MSYLDQIVYQAAVKEALFRSASIVVADMATGEILTASDPAEAMFGYRDNEMIGLSVDVLLPTSLRAAHVKHREAFADSPRTRAMGSGMILRGYRKDGTEFPIQVGLIPEEVMGRKIVVAIIMDLTEAVKTAQMIQFGSDPPVGVKPKH